MKIGLDFQRTDFHINTSAAVAFYGWLEIGVGFHTQDQIICFFSAVIYTASQTSRIHTSRLTCGSSWRNTHAWPKEWEAQEHASVYSRHWSLRRKRYVIRCLDTVHTCDNGRSSSSRSLLRVVLTSNVVDRCIYHVPDQINKYSRL